MMSTSTNPDKDEIKDTSTPHLSLSGKLRDRDEEHLFPVVDCNECSMTNAPYSISVITDGYEWITRWWCLNCSHVTLTRPEIKGWVGIIDLEECGWDSEL